ncbi:MAG: hypothetical protein V5804_15665 [Mucilaginibacter sp.]|uniref:hypothetical protein n=1 Tax=Mucilaginibacter sp. TaxID=1882438 RepID=UPI0034E4BA9C
MELAGCKFIKNEKGHCKYSRSDLFRPIIFQNHINPIPEFIIKNLLRLFPYTKDDFFDILEGVKKVERNGNTFTLTTKDKKNP